MQRRWMPSKRRRKELGDLAHVFRLINDSGVEGRSGFVTVSLSGVLSNVSGAASFCN